jgi:hypothetical protein
MSQRIVHALLVFGLLSGASLAAFAAKLEIKGLEVGASQREIVAQLEGLRCPVPDPPKPIDDCEYVRTNSWYPNVTLLNTLAEELVDRWQFHFVRGHLGKIVVVLPHSSFPVVRRALERKFGRPAMQQEEALQNRMGARFSGVVETWRDASASLTVREYDGSTESSAVTLTAPWFIDATRRESERRVKRRASDL